MKKSCVVLYSGGADSLTLLCYALGKYEEVHTLAVNYGSRHNYRELGAVQKVLGLLKKQAIEVNSRFIDFPNLGQLGGSPLIDRKIAVPKQKEGKQTSTVVPFRNTILLTLATSYAKKVGASDVLIGATFEDLVSYPDCRLEYFKSLQKTLRLADTFHHLEIVTPFVTEKKVDLINRWRCGVPYHLSYTCYLGQKTHCGECDACKERIDSFGQNKYIDPVEYEKGVKLPWLGKEADFYAVRWQNSDLSLHSLQHLAKNFDRRYDKD